MNRCILLALSLSLPLQSVLSQPPARQSPPERTEARSADDLKQRIEVLARSTQDKENAAARLTRMLGAESPEIQWRAARAISRLGVAAPGMADRLRKLASSSDAAVKVHSIRALGKIGDKSEATVDLLVKVVTSEDAVLARAAVQAVRDLQLPPESTAEALNKVFNSDNHAVATYAVEAAIQSGEKATPVLIELLKNDKSAFWAALAIGEIGPDAAGTVPALGEAIGRSDDPILLTQLCMAAAKIGPPAKSAAANICKALGKTDDVTLRLSASYALGAIGAEDCESSLKECATCDDEFVAMVATWAMAKTSGKPDQVTTAVDKLTKGLTNENERMRYAAAMGLLELGAAPDVVAPRLMAAANNADPVKRAYLVGALASLGDAIVPKVINGLGVKDSQALALEVIEQLGPKAAEAVPALLELHESADAATQVKVQFAFARIGPAASAAVGKLVESLESDNKALRESALYALREMGPAAKDAVDVIMPKMGINDDSVESLGRAWALASIAPADPAVVKAVLPVLKAGLENESELVRLETLISIAELGPEAASLREDIVKVSKNDESDMVRNMAQVVLEKKQ